MTEIQNTFIKILRAYIHNKPISLPENTDFNGLFELAKIHSVAGIVAAMNRKNKFPMPAELSQKFDGYMMAAVSQSVTWDRLYKEVSEALAAEGIKNIAVKGPVVKKYYPDPDLRTMGDIDFVVHKDNMPQVHKVMEKLGFSICESSVDEYKFERNHMYIELHEDLTSADFGTGVNYKKEMQYIFNCVKNPDECIQTLTDECHLVYLILHIAHHLFSSGCGVRQILDVALAIKHSEFDVNNVLEQFDSFKLTELAHVIFYLCNEWFNVKCEDYNIDNDLYEFISEHILVGGVFGFDANRADNQKVRDSIKEKNKLKFLLSHAFPDIQQMRAYILWFRNKPAVLLPVAWVYRWFKSYKDHPERINQYLKKSVVTGDKKIEKEYEMLKKLGFYQD